MDKPKLIRSKRLKHVWGNKDIVLEYYFDKSLSSLAISKIFNCGHSTIRRVIRNSGKETRGPKEASLLRCKGETLSAKGYVMVKRLDHPFTQKLGDI